MVWRELLQPVVLTADERYAVDRWRTVPRQEAGRRSREK